MASLLSISPIALADIAIDGGTQPRDRIDVNYVADLVEKIQADIDSVPPADVFFDGVKHWLADGFHRYHAHAKAKIPHMLCAIRTGTVRDAILFSVGANREHGLRRTHADKTKVMTLVRDEEWSKWSSREIADKCGVSHNFVASLRRTAPPVPSPVRQAICNPITDAPSRLANPICNPITDAPPICNQITDAPDYDDPSAPVRAASPAPVAAFAPPVRLATRNGTTYEMKVGNIGRTPAPPPSPVTPREPEGLGYLFNEAIVNLREQIEIQKKRNWEFDTSFTSAVDAVESIIEFLISD